MESSDDEGDSAAASLLAKTAFALFIFLPSCQKPQRSYQVDLRPADTVAVAKKTPPPVAQKKKSSKKKLYITFDDGPNKGTSNVLHIVKDEGVPVSFFIVGEHAFASTGQSRVWDSLRMAQHIELCNHSYTHGWHNRFNRYYENPDSVVADFKRAHDSLGLTNAIVRTPGRNIWRIDSLHFTDLKKSAAAADSLRNAGFTVMGWDLEWHYDHKTMSVTHTATELVQKIDSIFTHNKTMQDGHLVLLAHDQVYGKTADSLQLRQFLQLIKQKDEYELSVVTAYPGARKM